MIISYFPVNIKILTGQHHPIFHVNINVSDALCKWLNIIISLYLISRVRRNVNQTKKIYINLCNFYNNKCIAFFFLTQLLLKLLANIFRRLENLARRAKDRRKDVVKIRRNQSRHKTNWDLKKIYCNF